MKCLPQGMPINDRNRYVSSIVVVTEPIFILQCSKKPYPTEGYNLAIYWGVPYVSQIKCYS